MTQCTHDIDEERARILFILLKILHRYGLLHNVEFNINQLFIITKNMLKVLDSYNDYAFLGISNTWCGILNEPKNSFQIDTVDKLKCLSAVFSIDLAWKLQKVLNSSHHFQVTKNTKQKLFIINLALICFHKFDDLLIISFRLFLKQVNRWFQKYIKTKLFIDGTIENQLLLIQHCIKGQFSLRTNISFEEEQDYYRHLKRFVQYPSLSNIFYTKDFIRYFY
ncbi:hypothetical protein RF11_08164 [Thelohanellus kitauei]|uniref:Uncharacterized protein n=1 Tax=Thelohanellus kitauei TaxID=669202 RepID=A0A0C2J594_THEKT|nr:hypothetical protein RF11_08164 [Thelohanellus kitauei]